MANTIRIEREDPITLDEWKCVVGSAAGVRFRKGDYSAANPATGEVVTVGLAEGDSEINIDGEWFPCFHLFEGSIIFKAGTFDPDSEFGRIARDMAAQLGAKLVGDDGEYYD